MTMGRVLTFALATLAAVAVLAPAAPAAAAPGDMQYVGIDNHDPRAFQRALRTGADFVRSGRGRRFQIILAGRGVILVIPGTSTVQKDVGQLRAPGLKIVACQETLAALQQANRKRIPVISGVTVEKCQGLRNRLSTTGWQTVPGL